MFARLWWYLGRLSPHQLRKKQQQKNVKVGPPLAKLSGSAHVKVVNSRLLPATANSTLVFHVCEVSSTAVTATAVLLVVAVATMMLAVGTAKYF